MKKILLTILFLLLIVPFAGAINTDPQNSCTINTSSALTAHATDCTGTTAVADVICYERDADTFYVCEPSAGDCDTAGEWKVLQPVGDSGEIDTFAELDAIVADESLVAQSAIDTFAEIDAIVADESLVAQSAIDTFAELDTLVADESLLKSGTLTDTKACTYDTAGTDIVCNSDFIPFSGAVTVQDLDVADSGDGLAATATLNPTSVIVIVTCNDTDGCDITMGESDTSARTVSITNDSANAVNFADTGGVSELAGVFAMGQNDSLQIIYTGSTWVETSRSDN